MPILSILLQTVVGGFTSAVCLPLLCRRSVQPKDAFATALIIGLLFEIIALVSGRVIATKEVDFTIAVVVTMAVCMAAGAGVVAWRHSVSALTGVCVCLIRGVLAIASAFGTGLLREALR